MIKNILCLFTLLIISSTALAQVEIKGKVTSQKEIIAFANVVVKDEANKIVSGAITEDDGSFTVSVEKGKYTITISYLGYQEWRKEIDLTEELATVFDVGTIVLEEAATELKSVTVVAEKPIFQRKTDRLVFNVEQSVAAQGGDALDALSVAPGVTVQDGVISMLGKSGMRVMIDGRISNLAGDELLNFLNSIQASDIKSVEIITNPPAKYEAQGNGGLINIILKRARENSWNNSISTSYRQMILPMFTVGNNFKYRKNRVNILATANARLGDQRYIQEAEIFYDQSTWETYTSQDRDIEDFSGRLIFDYEINDKSKIGFQVSASTSNPFWKDFANTDILNPSRQLDSIIKSNGTRDAGTNNLSLNAHYSAQLDTLGRNISVDLDYFKFSATDERDIVANIFDSNNQFQNPNFLGFNGTDRDVSNYSARIDIEHPFKAFDFSYGAKISYIDSDYEVTNIDEIFNINQQDKFNYIERIQAVYVNMFKKFNDKWSMQLGLRLENTDTQGTSGSLNITTDIDYTKLFPTVYLAYAPNENNSYSFNYGRRINRPYFAQLNPAEFFINRFASSTGNPFLQPSFNDNFELSHLYKGKLSTTIFFERETDGIGTIAVADNTTFNELISPFNYYTLYRYGLSESYSFKPVSWWSSQNLLFLVNYDSRITNAALNIPERRDFSYYLSTDNIINLSEDRSKSLQINYWYSAPFTRNQTENESNQALNIGYRMSMFSKKVQFGINFLDIFDTSPRKSINTVNGIRSTHLGFGVFRGRGFRFSLSYNFGNNKINVRNRKSGNDEEQRRTN
ncbi:outer membrane receptor protein involved in Fe transport [Kordia periserrulae]|uniref:Outer membrane receptor protein involved in Fe transport n=1 Tax=Kordia periserrulae TaxID=701523 RepID=A0A2T6BZ89_9FLAO|nr:TonB-dependent receptor [Kordia periserrulae]PTX61378.1 outer membrane receptor protein involved in Fe transport [Kordia periserrulae]